MLTLTKNPTEEVLNSHIYAFSQGDVDALMADYAEEAIFLTPEGLLRGKAEIRGLFKQLLADFPPGSDVEIAQQIIDEEVAYVVWSGESPRLKIPLATDTLLIRDGKIVIQTFAAQIEAKPMSDSDRGQVNTSAAEVYEAFFVPALFGEWGSRVAEAAHIQPGQRVLDVACGTGVLARAAAERVGPEGEVVGLDINEGMLAVARKKAPHIEWRHGPAEALPFEDDSFDVVVSQFALMFFEDRRAALSEMVRVLRPGGRLAVAVWDSLDNTPAYATVTAMLKRLFGDEAANALRSPFNLGDTALLQSLFTEAGIPNAQITTIEGTARFASIEAWVTTDVKGWTLADMIDDEQFHQLLTEAEKVLQPFVTADGSVAFSSPAHIVTAVR
ncbi:MAG: methyltransferase domain-containing protein [Anaerolineaceae bacterium]|nr:methyltransferase domain-containing protein [Anaerolineaceae bacterium]MCB9098865.1 methyltransferase domain-containing protein [Anaerolineales bacterium]